ncbi:MAG: A/G-specific adenine glycosylase [Thermomicrobiales bacterium]
MRYNSVMNANPSAPPSTPDLTHLPIIQQTLLDWYAREGRDLPWRRTRDSYAILVSELMLQQTQVDRVIPKWEAWLAQFPTITALAEAPTSDVIKAWSGLGYNRRAINLQRLAQAVVAVHGGRVPDDVAELKVLPGIGPYTAGAVAAFAHNRPVAMVDVNIRRLLHRLFVGAETPDYRIAEGDIWALARAAVPLGRSADWHQALMDLGATICRPRPLCDRCPVRKWCRAAPEWALLPSDAPRPTKSQGKWEGSNRQYRGRILRTLGALPHGDALSLPLLGAQVRDRYSDADAAWLLGLVRALANDGLVLLSGDEETYTARLP